MSTVSNQGARARSPWFARATASFAVIQQAAHALYPGTSVFHRWRRLRLWLRSLMSWRSTQVWLKGCAISPLQDLVRRHPTALERMHRPFLHTRFSPRERLTASLDHHALTQQRVPQLAARIAAAGSAPIASFEVGAERWHVSLESIEQFQKEGDWTLCIRDARDRRIVSCTFSLAYLGGKVRRPRLCIGSVQGPDTSVNGRELFRALTKRWYGLRPKVLVIYLAQCVAAALDAGGTFIVSKQAHIYANWRYCLRKRRVAADYDRLSIECGALARWNGWFVLAPPARYLAERQGDDTGSATRRKRYALRSALAAQIRVSVSPGKASRLCLPRVVA